MIGSVELDAVDDCLPVTSRTRWRRAPRQVHTEREGIAVLEMILAGYESARTTTVVRVGGGVS